MVAVLVRELPSLRDLVRVILWITGETSQARPPFTDWVEDTEVEGHVVGDGELVCVGLDGHALVRASGIDPDTDHVAVAPECFAFDTVVCEAVDDEWYLAVLVEFDGHGTTP